MDLEGIMLSEISQIEKNIWFHLFVEYKNKTKQKEQNTIQLIDTEKWLVVTKGERNRQGQGEGEGDCWTTVMYIW